MTQEKKVQIWKDLQVCFFSFLFFFFRPLSAFRGFPGAVPVSIASVDANIISNILNFVFQGPAPEVSFFFFCSLWLD